jgi:hypothetical protein
MNGSMLWITSWSIWQTVGVLGFEEFAGIALNPDVDISYFLYFLPSLKV